MHEILQAPIADDWVVSTGETKSVRQMVEFVFEHLELNYKKFVVQDQKYLRPEELPYLKGDSSKIRRELGWSPQFKFEDLMIEMIEDWTRRLASQ
jgi:GDPmannose 4,6-dehydratase